MTDNELIEHARNIFRRAMFRPPNPDHVTEWAFEVCHEHLISETQLYSWLLDQGESFSSAYRLVYGPPPEEVYSDWKELAAYLRQRFGWTLEQIASYIRGWHDSQNASTVLRALDPEAAEKQREYDNAYQARVRADPDKHERQKARMREYSREYYRRKKDN